MPSGHLCCLSARAVDAAVGSVGATEFSDVDLGLLGEEVVAMPVYLGKGRSDRPLSSALRGDVHLLLWQDWSLLSAAEFSCCR